jgi:hypothetical protein
MGLCIIMLKHEVLAADERHDNGPQDLVTVQMGLLSVAYACQYHNPTAIMGHVDISKPLFQHMKPTHAAFMFMFSVVRHHRERLELLCGVSVILYSIVVGS